MKGLVSFREQSREQTILLLTWLNTKQKCDRQLCNQYVCQRMHTCSHSGKNAWKTVWWCHLVMAAMGRAPRRQTRSGAAGWRDALRCCNAFAWYIVVWWLIHDKDVGYCHNRYVKRSRSLFFSRVDWLSGVRLCYSFYNYHVRNVGGTNLLLFICTWGFTRRFHQHIIITVWDCCCTVYNSFLVRI